MDRVINTLLPTLVKEGRFGPGEFHSVVKYEASDVGFQFGSIIAMFEVKLLYNNKLGSIPIVVKIQMPGEKNREVRGSAAMFHNEVIMYNEVLPYLNKISYIPYPKIYFGQASGGEDYERDVLILENVKEKSFQLCTEQVYLDFEHISLAMKKIGELHACSYQAKHKDGKAFKEIISKFKPWCMTKDEEFDFELMNFLSIKKGLDPFIKAGVEEEALKKFLKITEQVFEISKWFWRAEEPFGVVIHGDFCKNNLFYKYDDSGRPTDVCYFDFQLSKYGSPAVDLAFFLYLHTSAEMREKHWDDFLAIYWNAVKAGGGESLPTFHQFLDHFNSRAVYGYLISSFFLPRMLEKETLNIEEFPLLSKEERMTRHLNAGGKEGEVGVQNIVSHLLKKNYIKKFLECYEKSTILP